MPDEFKVIYLKKVRLAVSEIFERARNAGMQAEVSGLIQLIDERLRTQPREFGDPLATLVGLELDLFSRGVKPLIVYYGVHRNKRLVFVNKIGVLPFSGL